MNPKVPAPKYGSPYLNMPKRGDKNMPYPRRKAEAEGSDPTQVKRPLAQLKQPAPRKHTGAEGWKDTSTIREGVFEERLDGMEPPPNTITNKPGGKPAPRPTGLKANVERAQRNLRRAGVRKEEDDMADEKKKEFEAELVQSEKIPGPRGIDVSPVYSSPYLNQGSGDSAELNPPEVRRKIAEAKPAGQLGVERNIREKATLEEAKLKGRETDKNVDAMQNRRKAIDAWRAATFAARASGKPLPLHPDKIAEQQSEPKARGIAGATDWRGAVPYMNTASKDRAASIITPSTPVSPTPGASPAPAQSTPGNARSAGVDAILRRHGIDPEKLAQTKAPTPKPAAGLSPAVATILRRHGIDPSKLASQSTQAAQPVQPPVKETLEMAHEMASRLAKLRGKEAPVALKRKEDFMNARKSEEWTADLKKALGGMQQNVEQADATAQSPAPETQGNVHHVAATKHKAQAEEHRHLATKYKDHADKAKTFQDVASHHDHLAQWHERQGQQPKVQTSAPKGDAAREAMDSHMSQHLGTPTDKHKDDHERKREVFSRRLEQLVHEHFGSKKVETPKHQQHSSNDESEVKLPKKSVMSEKKIAAAGAPPPPKKD